MIFQHRYIYLFIYLGFYVAFNTVQVISRRVVGSGEQTSTYSSSWFCTVNCQPTASNYQLSHLRPCRESNPGLRGGRRECYHSSTVAPFNTDIKQTLTRVNLLKLKRQKFFYNFTTICDIFDAKTLHQHAILFGKFIFQIDCFNRNTFIYCYQ